MKAILTRRLPSGKYRAADLDGNKVTISETEINEPVYRTDFHDFAAIKLCRKMNWDNQDLIRGAIKGGYVYVFDGKYERISFSNKVRTV